MKDVIGASGLAVRNCRFERHRHRHPERSTRDSKDFYIADNVLLGRNDHCRDARLGESRALRSASASTATTAIKVYGSGHVVATTT